MSAPELSTDLAALTLSMLREERALGRQIGRVEALRDASKILLREIDAAFAAGDKRAKDRLEVARRRIERLTVEPLPPLDVSGKGGGS